MLDNILIVLILFSIVLSFFIVKVWKKKNFVKELYRSINCILCYYNCNYDWFTNYVLHIIKRITI